MNTIRLQLALARTGIASRRKASAFIEAGHVSVNGKAVTERGFRVDVSRDKITLDGKRLIFQEKKYYYVLNKPVNVVSTLKDEHGRKKVTDYIAHKGARLYPVGRLDMKTTGLIILTNDGELTYRLTHPKFEIDRVYKARVKGNVTSEEASRLEKGVMVEGKIAKAFKVEFKNQEERFTTLLLVLREGRKREVRRMFMAIGHPVVKLKRISYGPLKLGDMEEGVYRPLTADELAKLKKCVGIT